MNSQRAIIYKVGDSFICPKCNHTDSKLTNLKKHIKYKHKLLVPARPPSVNYPHKCDLCIKYFKSKKSLWAHCRRFHNSVANFKKHKCPLCSNNLEKKHFNEHFEKSHGLLLKPVKIYLDSYEEFFEWKKGIESVTKTYFSKFYTHQRVNNVHHMFVCHRSGTFKSTGQNKRKLKAQGSIKIDAFCPAAIELIVTQEGKCDIEFQSQHLGHEDELKYLNLTVEDRACIAKKLAYKIPFDEILEEIHNYASKIGHERLQLLTRKDLRNIKASMLVDKTLSHSATNLDKNITIRLRDIHDKHADSACIKADIVKIEIGWLLKYVENNESYIIRKMLKSCDCPLICTLCKICIKLYACSCPDSSVEGNMCKHIHFFHMEMNKMHEVPVSNDSVDSSDCNNDCIDSSDYNNDCIDSSDNSNGFLDCRNGPLITEEVVSIPQQSGDDFQASNNLRSNSPTRDKPEVTTFIDSEKKSILKNKFCHLIDSIKTEEEYRLFENTMKELADKLKTIHSKAEDTTICPATMHSSSPELIIKNNTPNLNNSNSSETGRKALLLKVHDPMTNEPRYFCMLAQQNSNNVA